jgi:hypothetical protein
VTFISRTPPLCSITCVTPWSKGEYLTASTHVADNTHNHLRHSASLHHSECYASFVAMHKNAHVGLLQRLWWRRGNWHLLWPEQDGGNRRLYLATRLEFKETPWLLVRTRSVQTTAAVSWAGLLATDPEAPGSIPGVCVSMTNCAQPRECYWGPIWMKSTEINGRREPLSWPSNIL